jgi:hypothetical protein
MEVMVYRARGATSEARLVTSLEKLDAALKDGWFTSEADALAAVPPPTPATEAPAPEPDRKSSGKSSKKK